MGHGWAVNGFGGEVHLVVISIAMEVKVEVVDDETKGGYVADEEGRTKDRALGDSLCDGGESGGVTGERN